MFGSGLTLRGLHGLTRPAAGVLFPYCIAYNFEGVKVGLF